MRSFILSQCRDLRMGVTVRQYRLLIFTNTESLSKTKQFNFQDGPKK